MDINAKKKLLCLKKSLIQLYRKKFGKKNNDFNLYWPMALVSDPISGKPETVFTYEGCLTIEDAKKQIELWKGMKDSLVYFAYIHDDNEHIVYYENNVSTFGLVKYKSENKHDFSEEINNNKGHKR